MSILAGKTLSDIQQELSLNCNIARAMPNINAISKHAATAICYTDKVSDEKKKTSGRSPLWYGDGHFSY